MNSGGLARGTGRGPERAESVMVLGGRPLAVPRYSGTIKCDDLPQRGLKVSILIDLLARHYTLSAADLAAIRRCRGDHNRLGHALMLCYLRYPGRPLKAGE